jgi:hypothetical protein
VGGDKGGSIAGSSKHTPISSPAAAPVPVPIAAPVIVSAGAAAHVGFITSLRFTACGTAKRTIGTHRRTSSLCEKRKKKGFKKKG